MAYSEEDKLIALSGIYQAALCVHRIARQGSVDEETMAPCIYSLFQTDADSVQEVYGAPGSLIPGAKELLGQLTGKQPRGLEPTRYVIGLLKLEQVLSRRTEAIEAIQTGMEEARTKLAHFPMLHANMLARLADLYSRTISPLRPRIMIQGNPPYLQIQDNQNRMRALLLAGIRSAWLWRQVGGSRWKILLGRNKLLAAAREYLRLSQN